MCAAVVGDHPHARARKVARDEGGVTVRGVACSESERKVWEKDTG